tara:strand:+ start:79 stop:624 length:546 start_codon:yes stop_codon:yes gene_type:complete
MCVAYLVSGNVFGSIKITDLESYGGFTSEHIKNFELWRLFVAQIIHSKQLHMVYNVLALLALGFLLEKRIGYLWFVSTWFVSGALGTLYSTLFVVAPWNIGTGGSQAIFGLCGLGFVLLHKFESKLLLTIGLFFAIFPALALDLIFAGYPKPGHMCGFTIGLLMGLVFMVSRKGKEIKLIG